MRPSRCRSSRDNAFVGAVVGDQLLDLGVRHALGEFEDVADRGTAEAVEALVFVADNAEVACRFREFEEDLFLDVVGVLVLVNHDKLYVASDAGGDVGVF